METIEGIIDEIIYRNEDNGYTVLAVYADEQDITLVGTMFNLTVGEEIRATGTYVSHQTYGQQFKVEQFQTFMPRDIKAMERYLGSGAIKGIGPALASRIVEHFGTDTFSMMENEPHKLSEIKGISVKKAQEISTLFESQRRMRQVIIFLQAYGVTLTYALKIYQAYQDDTIKVIKENPYRLAEDIHGIGFKLADHLAIKIGYDLESLPRLKAAITYILTQGALNGHTFVEEDRLIDHAGNLLGTEIVAIEQALMTLQLEHKVVVYPYGDTSAVYLAHYDQMERYVAGKLSDLAKVPFEQDATIDHDLEVYEAEGDLTLHDKQRDAIVDALNFGVFILTGGPGTGKTTTINMIIKSLVERDYEVLLAAPTGRAAKRMTETTGYPSKTIHRLLEITYGKDELHQRFERNEGYPLEADVVIVDEVSMVDITLMYHLLKAIPEGTRLILVGDQDQLPSVGPGNVLKDMLKSKELPFVALTEVFRQAAESDIVVNAHRINHGEALSIKAKQDFFLIRKPNPSECLLEIITLVQKRLPKFLSQEHSEGIQILTPMRKGILGVESLNQALQKALNKSHPEKKEKLYRQTTFREGDQVMQIRNNYNVHWEIKNALGFMLDEGSGIFNGDMGRIMEINHFSEQIKVRFDDGKVVLYDFTNLDELELAYAITIHKSQGSEYPVVILPLFTGPPMLMTRNLLYTAITRAKHMVVLVGRPEVVDQMIANNKEVHRNTMLALRLTESFAL